MACRDSRHLRRTSTHNPHERLLQGKSIKGINLDAREEQNRVKVFYALRATSRWYGGGIAQISMHPSPR